MDTIFADTSVTSDATELWSVDCDCELLRTTLQKASKQATRLGRGILASFTQSVKVCDPLRIFLAFRLLQMGECIFWERPSEQRAFVGVGATTTIETTGPARFSTAASAWRALQRDTVVGSAPENIPDSTSGPLLFGGFAFDPLHLYTQLWDGFPDGLLILPHLLFHSSGDCATLTINTMVQASDNIELYIEEISASISSLHSAVERTEPCLQPAISEPCGQLSAQDLLDPSEWKNQVADAAKEIQHGAYEKVVLARGVQVMIEAESFKIDATLGRLRASYPRAYVFAIQRGHRYFVGATPERLVCSQDGRIQTAALAGSAPRGATEDEDERLGRELLRSEKNKGEHQIVVATIRDALASLCSEVHVDEAPRLLKLKNIQHLETSIMGELLPNRCILEAIEDLHPTPAVGGFPRLLALEVIRANEKLDRGWYAGPIGWIGASGDGEFAVALRSALVDGNKATLFAGCGIVADSDAESEYAESCLKLQVMLRGLGGED